MSRVGMSWGRFPKVDSRLLPVFNRAAALPDFVGTALPFGNGRSYGDSCLNSGGTLLGARTLDHFIGFDPESGILDCEAGVLLSEILAIALPHGWFLPVTPGTRFVTVGGAIANDVHGKNHPKAGSFGAHVLDLELLRSDGQRIQCSRDMHCEWFHATVAGLGLTGLITRARIRLRRVPGRGMDVDTQRFDRLADFFELSRASSGREYSVAWVDCLARGRKLGRGVFMAADHGTGAGKPTRGPKFRFPFDPPISLVNAISLRAFNTAYLHRAPREARRTQVHYTSYFYPLDSVAEWNRMYGPRGFLQYQCVIPEVNAQAATAELLDRIAASGQGSFLVVLKQLGGHPPEGMLSFPRAGTTLALDFPFRGRSTLELLSGLDDVVMSAGGGLYPAKDARMSAGMFNATFPEWRAFREYVDPRFSSSFWRRVTEST